MKIEVGKFYKTRDDKKVRIYATDAGEGYPVHGAIEDEFGWTSASWLASGQAVRYSQQHACDIVAEWPETVEIEGWIWLWANGELFYESLAPGPTLRTPTEVIGAVKVTGTIAPGTYDD